MADSLRALSRSLGGPPVEAMSTLFQNWAEVVGEDLAAHTTPVALRAGVLHLEVDHPGWATQLKFLEADLRARVNESVGREVVHSVEVRIRRRPRHP